MVYGEHDKDKMKLALLLKSVPTQRTADGGYAPRFLSSFLALSFSRFDGESTLPPQAGTLMGALRALTVRRAESKQANRFERQLIQNG